MSNASNGQGGPRTMSAAQEASLRALATTQGALAFRAELDAERAAHGETMAALDDARTAHARTLAALDDALRIGNAFMEAVRADSGRAYPWPEWDQFVTRVGVSGILRAARGEVRP